jgi:RNA 2',3'-cyclic 3'-phosphodiesterase
MRTFIALPLPMDAQQTLAKAITELAPASADAKWVVPQNLHITLKFLGDIKPEQSADIQKVIGRVADGHTSIAADLEKLGFLPDQHKPRILYVSTSQEEKMRLLYNDLEKALKSLGFAIENRFRSHITLARLRSAYNLEQLKNKAATMKIHAAFILTNIVLFKSTLDSRGPVYEELYSAELTGPEPDPRK